MNEEEWVLYGAVHAPNAASATSAQTWEAFVKYQTETGNEINLTLLARGLTKEQAHAMAKLTQENK